MKINIKIPEYIRGFIDKYKYPLIIFVIGIAMAAFSGEKTEAESVSIPKEDKVFTLETQIENALGKIDGVGRVEVILSLKSSEQNIYAKEEVKQDASEIVIVNENGSQKALVEYTESPVFKGALIVCDGGDNSKVRLEVTDAVKALTGISSQNIIITKMKK